MSALCKPFRIATLNVRGLSAKRKQNQLYRMVTERDLDVVAIQETKVESEDQTDCMVRPFTAHYYACVSHAVGMSAGCVLLIRKSLGVVVQNVTVCLNGRFIVCDFAFSANKWRVICIYAPTRVQERRDFFEEIRKYCSGDRYIVLMGDFNCVCSARDKTSCTPYRDVSTTLLCEMVNDLGLEDVGECVGSGIDVQYTHFQGASHARLDRAYISAELLPWCCDYSVHSVSFSDHCVVSFCLGSKKENRSKFTWDLWKFNDKLLEDDLLMQQVRATVENISNSSSEKLGVQWEHFKQETKMQAIERGTAIKKERQKQESFLRTCLQAMVEEESRVPGTFKDEIKATKAKLELIDAERYHAALVRARAEKLIAGEMPTKRALGTEKRYARRNEITEIEYNGVVSGENTEIERAFFEHYSTLFSRSAIQLEKFEREFVSLLPKIDDETRLLLESPITVEEVKEAINNLNLGKSPGPDGLSAAFYKFLKHEISPVLTAVFREAFMLGVLPPSFSAAHTILIPKTEDTVKLRQVTSYRPISLTNVDYKILMKILAKRLQTVIGIIVGPHQTCGIKGRSIVTNIHKARSVLESCDVMHTGVAMLQVDLDKAFDRVPHDGLMAVLEHINIGSVILEGVRMAYNKCTTRIIVNKVLGRRIEVQRSVRQGCPLSPLLFCIYIESLCLTIMRNETVKGFQLHAAEVRVLAYADDIAIFCVDQESVAQVVNLVKWFCHVSGCAVNWDKCLGIWHGEWSTTPAVFKNIKWVTTPVKYLGVPLEYYSDSDPYWRKQAVELREKAEKWKGTNLSIFARATVCNLFMVSKLWYVLQVLHCSRANVQKLHRVFAVFIWGSSWERTSRTNLFRRVRDGGLGLTHFFLRQLVNRFLFLRDVKDPFLRTVCQIRLGRVLPEFIVTTLCLPGGIRGYLKEVVESFRFLAVRFSLDYLSAVSRKRLYGDLCDTVLPVPLYRVTYSAGPGRDVLKRVKKMPVAPGIKTFFFKLHTGTLLVKTWMQEKGLFMPWGEQCWLCKKPETIEHVFIDCWDGVFFWDVLQRTLKKDLPVDAHGIRYLSVEHDEEGVPLDLIMLLGLHSIWRCRLAVRHSDIDARPVREYFQEAIVSFVELKKTQQSVPEWLSRVEKLTKIKIF